MLGSHKALGSSEFPGRELGVKGSPSSRLLCKALHFGPSDTEIIWEFYGKSSAAHVMLVARTTESKVLRNEAVSLCLVPSFLPPPICAVKVLLPELRIFNILFM